MPRVLVVDDETNLRQNIAMLLRARGYEVTLAATGQEALAQQRQTPAEAVVLDLVLPDLSGLEVLQRLREKDPTLPCVMVTAFGSIPSAVQAMRDGAADYVTKPFDNNDLVLRLERALEMRRLTTRVTQLEEDLSARTGFSNVVGRSQAIEDVLRRLAKVARNTA